MVLSSFIQQSLKMIVVFFMKAGTNQNLTFCIKEKYNLQKIAIHFPKNVLRGLHYQVHPFEQEKLVSCINGEIYDVIVDLRPRSSSFKAGFQLN